jgi:hypothetical protein
VRGERTIRRPERRESPRATPEIEVQIEDLADLSAAWAKLGTIKARQAWSKEIEPYIVSATPHWQVFRVG